MDANGRATAARITIFYCFLAALCEGADIQAAGLSAAGLTRDFAPTPGQLGAFFSASNLGLLLGAIAGGRVADEIGRKAVILASLVSFGVCSLVTSLAWSMETLTWARALTGIGLGGAMPNLIALVTETSTPKTRNLGIAATYSGFPIGAAIASSIMFAIGAERWRTIFVCGGLAPFLIAPFMAAFMAYPVTARVAPRKKRVIGPFRQLFGRGLWIRTVILWTGFLLIALTLHLILNWLPLLLKARGLGSGHAALAQAGFNVGGAAMAVGVGRLLDTRWQRTIVAASVVALPAALLSIANAPVHPGTMAGLAVLLGGSVLAGQVVLYGVAGASYPATARGTGVGAAVGASRVGALIGPMFAALLLQVGHTAREVLMGVMPIVLAGAVCVAAVAWRWPGRRLD